MQGARSSEWFSVFSRACSNQFSRPFALLSPRPDRSPADSCSAESLVVISPPAANDGRRRLAGSGDWWELVSTPPWASKRGGHRGRRSLPSAMAEAEGTKEMTFKL